MWTKTSKLQSAVLQYYRLFQLIVYMSLFLLLANILIRQNKFALSSAHASTDKINLYVPSLYLFFLPFLYLYFLLNNFIFIFLFLRFSVALVHFKKVIRCFFFFSISLSFSASTTLQLTIIVVSVR